MKRSHAARERTSPEPPPDFRTLLGNQAAPEGRAGEVLLEDGDTVAVIGGGPAGSLFSYFTLRMARMLGRAVKVVIFEPKNFLGRGPASCNHCGGIVSELMVQTLAVEGINIPSSVVQRGVDSYQLHTEKGDVRIETPASEKTIAAVYRGGGPRGLSIEDKESFDHFLLRSAVREGAEHVPATVEKVVFEGGRPVLFTGGKGPFRADLVVGAFGVNNRRTPRFEGMDFQYQAPSRTKTAIAEIGMEPDYISRTFGNAVHLFLLPVRNVKFAALIPKRSYVTLCMIGRGLNKNRMQQFLSHPKVRNLFPEGELEKLNCMCLPLMNIGAPVKPYADRVVMVGDAGSSRLYKDGIGAAYFMGKSAAKTVVMHGIGEEHFRENYMRDYRSLMADNRFGRFLFWFTDLVRRYGFLTSAMLDVVQRESRDPDDGRKVLNSILWDMFTGNERYRDIFYKAVSPELVLKMTASTAGQVFKDLKGNPGGP